MAETPIRVTENPFGEVSEEQLKGQALSDNFYLKGYSDKRHERELAIKQGRKPETLPRRFQFVSVEDRSGKPVGEKQLAFRRMGYRPVSFDEAKSLGLDLDNSTAVKGPDGNVRVGSQMLMVIDSGGAARHYRDQREATARQFDQHVRGPLEAAADKYNAQHGRTKQSGTVFELEETIE